MAEKIVVSVRVRPLNAKEEAKGTAWDVDNEKHAITPKVRHRPAHTELNRGHTHKTHKTHTHTHTHTHAAVIPLFNL